MRWFRSSSATEDPEGPPPPVFFVHVMKSGGTTITRHLRETYELDQIYPSSALDLRHTDAGLDLDHHLSLPYLQNLSAERRARIRVYIGHFPYVARDLLDPQLLAATVLREPVERTISLLRQLTPQGEKTLTYFFGPEFSEPLSVLTAMGDRLGLPRGLHTIVCQDEAQLEKVRFQTERY